MDSKRFYTIKELSKEVNRTPQTIYNHMRENLVFFQEHRQERSKGGYVYDEEVLKLLKNRFLIESAVGLDENKQEASEIPELSAPSPDVEQMRMELEEIKSKFQALQADFEKVERERVELLRQNGLKTDEINHLLLLLSQEKAEKQALLPPPRRKFADRLKQIFQRTQEEKKDNPSAPLSL